MARLARLLTALLAFTLLATNSASAITASLVEKPASGLFGSLEQRVGIDALASAGRIDEKLSLLYGFASDFPVAARSVADVEKAAVAGKRTFSTADRAAGLEKSKDAAGVPRCQYCGSKLDPRPGRPNSYEADHTTPYSRGGPSSPENLTPSCRTCNRSKGAQTPDEWGGP